MERFPFDSRTFIWSECYGTSHHPNPTNAAALAFLIAFYLQNITSSIPFYHILKIMKEKQEPCYQEYTPDFIAKRDLWEYTDR